VKAHAEKSVRLALVATFNFLLERSVPMLMIEEMETVVAPMSEAATDFWTGFLIGLAIGAACCGGA